MNRDAFAPFYGWLLMFGLTLLGAIWLWQLGLFDQLISTDQTYLSGIILLIFLAVSLYLGRAAWRLAKEAEKTVSIEKQLDSGSSFEDTPNNEGLAQEYLRQIRLTGIHPGDSPDRQSLQEQLTERAHRGHGSGWFFSDLLLRLGLVGTVIGFVLMLGAVNEIRQDDIQGLQELLARMGGGMRVALYTTLAGLGTGILISIQCHWLDRYADRLISRIIRLSVLSLANAQQVEPPRD